MANPDFGVREFINLLLALLAFYLRHKPNIDANLQEGTVATLENLVALMPAFQAMNIPGPNPVVPTQEGGDL